MIILSVRQGGICPPPGGEGGHVLVTEFRGMALNGLFCADGLRPLDLVPITDFTYEYRYYPAVRYVGKTWHTHITV